MSCTDAEIHRLCTVQCLNNVVIFNGSFCLKYSGFLMEINVPIHKYCHKKCSGRNGKEMRWDRRKASSRECVKNGWLKQSLRFARYTYPCTIYICIIIFHVHLDIVAHTVHPLSHYVHTRRWMWLGRFPDVNNKSDFKNPLAHFHTSACTNYRNGYIEIKHNLHTSRQRTRVL